MEQHAQDGRDYDGKCFICHSQCPEDARLVMDLSLIHIYIQYSFRR